MTKQHKELPTCMGYAPVRNKWAAKCGHCGETVQAGKGFTHKIRGTTNGWFVTHGKCHLKQQTPTRDS